MKNYKKVIYYSRTDIINIELELELSEGSLMSKVERKKQFI